MDITINEYSNNETTDGDAMIYAEIYRQMQ